MEKKAGLGICIIIVLMLIMTSFVSALNLNPLEKRNQFDFYLFKIICDPYPQFDAFKQVWNGSAWVDECSVINGSIVRFNITVEYHDIDPEDYCYMVSQIEIIDDLGDFEYIGNPWISESGINPDDYLIFDPITNIYKWNFYNNITLSEKLTSYNRTLYFEFDAKANTEGTLVNNVCINGTEHCCNQPCSSEANATVYVEPEPCPNIDLTKYVKDNNIWNKTTTVKVGNDVEFKIIVNNTGNTIITRYAIKDDLPTFLTYNNDANITPSSSSAHHLQWNLTNLSINKTIEIVFTAHANATGEDDNYANVTTYEGPYDDDIAHVIVEETPIGELLCEKKVWDPDTQQWVEQINADIGDTIRFNITLTYTGDGVFMNIKVKDILPPCLQYANNASPVETGKSNNIIFWNLSNILQNGQNLSIEFDALVISSGTNINTANITGIGNCIQPLYCEDTATVIVKEIPHQDLICEKKVWDPDTQQWAEVINADIGDTVRFKITISYQGSLAFYSIWVNDTLPTCLKYNNNATPNEPVINGKKLTWFLDLFLRYGQNKSIEFDTLVISGGENINVVNITGWECGIHRLFCEDTATVIVMEPLIAEAGGPYTGYVGDPIQITGSATGGIPDYVYKWDLNNDGVYDDANGKTISHSWTTQGTKTIYLKVTDSMDKNDTDPATVTVNIRNQPPNTPSTPEGKATIKINKENAYTTLTTDPNGDQIWYWIDWGDETNSGWVGPFASGATATAPHIWTKRGTYQIKVKAKDSYNVESAYSNSFEVKVKFLVSQSVQIPTILQKLIERFPMLERFFYHYFSFSF